MFPYLDAMPGKSVLVLNDFVVKYDAAPADFVERCMRIGLASRRKPDGPFAINDQVQGLNSKRIIDGVTVKIGNEVSQETLAHLTVFVMFHAVYSTRAVNLITDIVERSVPRGPAIEATFTEMLRAESSYFRAIYDALFPYAAMNCTFARNYERYVKADICALAARAPEQFFQTFTSNTLTAGVPQMYNEIDPDYITRQQLSFEYARKILQEKPDAPRTILTPQPGLSIRQFKTMTRIQPSKENDNIRVKRIIQGQRTSMPLPSDETFVLIKGDGYCGFRAMQICSGVRFQMIGGYGIPVMEPECLRILCYGLWDPKYESYFVNLPGSTSWECERIKLEMDAGDRAKCLEPITSPLTWCAPVHMRTFCRVTDTDLVTVHGPASSWFVTRYPEGRPDRAMTMKMPLKAITHCDAYVRQLDVEARLWEVAFDVFSRRKDLNNSTTFFQTRQVVKLAELLELLPQPTGPVVEFGAAPGQWNTPLRQFAGDKLTVTAVSPVGLEFLLPTDAMFVAHVQPYRISDFRSAERYSLVVSDAATEDSWKTNDTLDELIRRLDDVLQPNGSLLVKVSNYTIVVFEQQYAEIVRQFRKVSLVKPVHSSVYNTEAYIVAEGFKETTSTATDLQTFVRGTTLKAALWSVDKYTADTVKLPRMMALGIVSVRVRAGGDVPAAEEVVSAGEEEDADASEVSQATAVGTGEVLDLNSSDLVDRLSTIDHPLIDTMQQMSKTECLKAGLADWVLHYLIPILVGDGKLMKQSVIFTSGRREISETRLIVREPREAEVVEATCLLAPRRPNVPWSF